MDAFHLLDLVSQAPAVQRLLKGYSSEEKLTWLRDHGQVMKVSVSNPGTRPIHRFESTIGQECLFFLDSGRFVFIGDHTTYTVEDWG